MEQNDNCLPENSQGKYLILRYPNRNFLQNKVSGLFECSKSINNKHKTEALENGLVLLSGSSRLNYNYYLFSKCGHTQFIQPTHIRRKSFFCRTCQIIEASNVVFNRSAFLLYSTGTAKNTYLQKCGHIKSSSMQHLCNSEQDVRCDKCFLSKIVNTAKESSLEILKSLGSCKFEVSFKDCGHTKIVHHSQIFRKNIVCQTCKELRYTHEAESFDLNCLGKLEKNKDSKNKRLYKLPCGHTKDLRISHVRSNNWKCDICEDSHLNKPSLVYLIEINTGDFVFCKLGYAKDLQARFKQYGIKSAKFKVIKTLAFETGDSAMRFEKRVHSKYKKDRIPVEVLEKIMISGKTECYPLDMLEKLNKEMQV